MLLRKGPRSGLRGLLLLSLSAKLWWEIKAVGKHPCTVHLCMFASSGACCKAAQTLEMLGAQNVPSLQQQFSIIKMGENTILLLSLLFASDTMNKSQRTQNSYKIFLRTLELHGCEYKI